MLRLLLISFVFCFISFQAIGNEMDQDLTKEMDTINFEKTIEYEVTEITQKPFGSSKISYIATSKSEIRTNDLGPNNKRIIKEKIVYKKRQKNPDQPTTFTKRKVLDSPKIQKLYSKAIQSIAQNNDIAFDSLKINNHQNLEQSNIFPKSRVSDSLKSQKLDSNAIQPLAQNINIGNDSLKINNNKTEYKSITIKPLETYERIVKDGFHTAEILDVLANQSFYNKKYKKAAEYFEKLFKLTNKVNEENTMKYQECIRNLKLEAQLAKNHSKNRITSKKRQ